MAWMIQYLSNCEFFGGFLSASNLISLLRTCSLRSLPNMQTRISSQAQKVKVGPLLQLLRISSSRSRGGLLLKRIASRMSWWLRMRRYDSVKSCLAWDQLTVSRSEISLLSTYSFPHCPTFSIICYTFSIDRQRASFRFCFIQSFSLFRNNGAYSSTASIYSYSTSSNLCDRSTSNLVCEMILAYSARSKSSGSIWMSPDSMRFERTACLWGALGYGACMPAKGTNFPLATFLKSSGSTPLGLLLTMLTISCTSSGVNSSSMQRMKKERSSKESMPSLLMSITWKASRISYQEQRSRLMSQPVLYRLKVLLCEMFL